MEYITFMHGNSDSKATEQEWSAFFAQASDSGLFRGGSAMGKRWTIGKEAAVASEAIAGYMRFDADSLDDLMALLNNHPTLVHGGTIEICELPKT